MSDVIVRLYGGQPVSTASVELPGRPLWFARLLRQADLDAREWAVLLALGYASVPLGVVALVAFGQTVSLVVLLVVLAVPAIVTARWRHRGLTRLIAGFPSAFDGLARDLRTGRPLAQAILRRASGRDAVARRFAHVGHSLELGRPLDLAAAGLAHLDDPPAVREGALLLVMASMGGAGAAIALEAGASAMRDRAGLRAELRALVAQSRASLRILAALPLGFVALGLVARLDATMSLFTTDAGRVCLGVGLTLDLVGLLWMRVLVRTVDS